MLKSEETNRRAEPILISLSVIMIIVSAFIIAPSFYPKNIEEPVEDVLLTEMKKSITKLSPVLNVTVLDKDGNLKAQQIKEDDLVLENFLKFFVGLLHDPNSVSRDISLRDTGGSSRSVAVYDEPCATWQNPCMPFNNVAVGAGGHIGIGNGTTAPTRTDYTLESQQEGWMGVSEVGYLLGLIAMSASWTVTDSYDVSEVVFMNDWADASSTRYDFALLRDTFTPISVIATDQVFVSYNIFLNNTGFTNSFGNFLASLFGQGEATRTFEMTDTGAGTRTFYSYYPYTGTTQNHWNYFTARVYMAMGGMETISRGSYQMTNMTGSYIGVSEPTQNTSTVMLSASQTMSVTLDIETAGLFVSWSDTGGNARIVMFWQLNFTSIPVYAGYTMTVAFKLIT